MDAGGGEKLLKNKRILFVHRISKKEKFYIEDYLDYRIFIRTDYVNAVHFQLW